MERERVLRIEREGIENGKREREGIENGRLRRVRSEE